MSKQQKPLLIDREAYLLLNKICRIVTETLSMNVLFLCALRIRLLIPIKFSKQICKFTTLFISLIICFVFIPHGM